MTGAWIVRMNTGVGDISEYGREANLLLLGWSGAEGIESLDYYPMRDAIHSAHYRDDDHYRRSGRAAGTLWNFIRVMEVGDYVIIPRPGAFWVGRVTGSAFEDLAGLDTDSIHRRPVEWCDGGIEIPRATARARLVARMKSRGTVTNASDLVEDIELALALGGEKEPPTGPSQLRARLIRETREELHSGHFSERRFEEVVRDLLSALGADNSTIVPRQQDVGVDIRAEFTVGGLAQVVVGAQVKYWRDEQGDATREPIDQLIAGMDDIDIGMVVVANRFTDDARAYADRRAEELGKPILTYDGDELSQLIIDQGLRDLAT